MKASYYKTVLLALVCVRGFLAPAVVLAQPTFFQHTYGTALNNSFTKTLRSGTGYYVLGRDEPSAGAPNRATVTRLDAQGQHQWTLRLDIASQWNDAVVTPNGNLLVVGNTLPFDANARSLMGLVTPSGAFSWVRSYNVPGRESFSRVVRNPSPNNGAFPYYILGIQWDPAGNANWDDVVLLTVSEAGNFGWKKRYTGLFGTTDDEFARDLEALPNGDLLLAGNLGTNGVVFRADNTGAFFSAAGPGGLSFSFADVARASDGFWAVGSTFPSVSAYLMKFDNDLLVQWQISLPDLTAVSQVWRDGDDGIYVTGRATANGVNRGVVLKFQDFGNDPAPLLWMKYLDNEEMAYTGGSSWYLPPSQLAFCDGRNTSERAFLSVSDLDMNTCMTVEGFVSTVSADLLFNSPLPPNIEFVDVPVGTNVTPSSAVNWEQEVVCPACSCDDVYFDVVQVPGTSDTCAYILTATNEGSYCFNEVNIALSAGVFESVTPANGWEVTVIDSQHVRLAVTGDDWTTFVFHRWRARAASMAEVTVSTSYNIGQGDVVCSRVFGVVCPPIVSVRTCCPAGNTLGAEQVLNGDFELGNQDFTNDYTYLAPGSPMPVGRYSVLDASEVYVANNQWTCMDHTASSPTGKMLVVDGYGGPIAWQQTVNVTAGTKYSFSAWANNLVRPPKDFDDPQVALFVGGAPIGAPLPLPETPDRWVRLCDTFLAPVTGPVMLSIRMLSTATIGNDVAIDDVSFRACVPPPSCACPPNAFANMSYRPSSGPNVPISCGEVAIWQCLLPVFNLGGNFLCQGSDCPGQPPVSWTLTHPILGQVDQGSSNGPGFGVSIPNASFSLPGLYTLTLEGICGDDTCYCEILIETPGCGSGCMCKQNDVTYSTAGMNIIIPCQQGPSIPVFFCPTGPVTISGDFGCVDAGGNPCPAVPPYPPINWILYGPSSNIIQQGTIVTGSPWTLPFTASDLAGSGSFTLYMTTFCPGQTDSCKCVATWFQECVNCTCGTNPWNSEFRYGGAQNQPVNCGDTLSVTQGSAFYPSFVCQGLPNCGRVDWTLTGPNGYFQSMIGVVPNANGDFVVPPLLPTNFPVPGTYSLQMLGICGQDTCPCTVYFCLPPPAPYVNDTSICRTLQSASIPMQDCPKDCDITQVQWFVKPCSASTWPLFPYQISGAGNPQDCDDLLLLPYQYANEACVQVYAIVQLAPGCCLPDLTTNIATINLCNPISCTINNPNPEFCQTGQPLPLIGVLSGANCGYTVEWYDESNQLVSTSLTYTPPVLTFPAGLTACYKDFVFTMKIVGICGTTSCATTIRVFNINSDNGDLKMDPLEAQPFCPGEDARLVYFDRCSGPPPKWQWYESTVSGSSGFVGISGAGMMNPTFYTNQLYQTTWFMVESQNGVCPPQRDVLKIEVKDAIQITNFTATPDPCVENQVVLTVGFTPSPIAGPGCQYSIDWYHNGDLIHTDVVSASPVSYTHFGPSIPGVYYAVVRDNCCPAVVQTWPAVIGLPCKPAILGPCYKCDMTTPAILYGEMVLPPKDDCPSGVVCTYQWYVLDVVPEPDVWVLLAGETNPTLSILKGGHYKLETQCNYGYGICTQEAYHTVAQCMGCMYVGDEEVPLPQELHVTIRPNPTAANMTVQIGPTPLRKGRVEVVDMNGRALVSSEIPEAQPSVTISLAQLPSGLYFVRVLESDVLLWTGKVVRSQ